MLFAILILKDGEIIMQNGLNLMEETTIVEQNQMIIELVETLNLCKKAMQKQENKINLLLESVQTSERSREFWIKKYYSIMEEIMQLEDKEKVNEEKLKSISKIMQKHKTSFEKNKFSDFEAALKKINNILEEGKY